MERRKPSLRDIESVRYPYAADESNWNSHWFFHTQNAYQANSSNVCFTQRDCMSEKGKHTVSLDVTDSLRELNPHGTWRRIGLIIFHRQNL